MSTCDNASLVQKERISKGNVRTNVLKPSIVENYNQEMGGIDLTDQVIRQYNCARKSHAWYKKIGLNCILRLLFNSWAVYRKEKESNVSFFDFLRDAIRVLTDLQSTPKGARRKRRPSEEQRTTTHVQKRIPSTTGKKNPLKRCRVCFSNGIRRESRYICDSCPDKPGLCLGDCFNKFKHD